jgi:hypothetical protein
MGGTAGGQKEANKYEESKIPAFGPPQDGNQQQRGSAKSIITNFKSMTNGSERSLKKEFCRQTPLYCFKSLDEAPV